MSEGNSYDTIIVGGGIAGLTASAYLARAGKKILLIEKNHECGGLVNSFQRDGFHFEAGIRALENAGIVKPMMEDLGIKLDLIKSKVSVGLEGEIINVRDISSLTDYRNLLVKFYPDSEDEIDKLLKIIRKIMKDMDVLYGVDNPLFKDFKKDRSFLFKKLLPWLPGFFMTLQKIKRLNMPVEEYLEKLISDNSLRDIISQHFWKNTPSFFALSYFSLYLDYFYPKEGVGKIAEAMEEKVREFGGEIQNNTVITKVIAKEKLLKDTNNQEYLYESLVWAADLKTLYNITETNGLSPKITSNIKKFKDNFMQYRGGDSIFALYLQVDEPIESFRKISNGHFFYTPYRQGLGKTHTEEMNSLLENWDNVSREDILKWLDRFISLNTFEISIPGLKNENLVPKGQTGLIISLLAEYDLFNKASESGWYDELRLEVEDRIIKVISDTVYPMLKDKITGRFSFSPISIKNRVASSEGAIVGWSFQQPVPVPNKIPQATRSVKTPIPSVFQAGQWTYSPAGVPMSILTGKIAADKVLKQFPVGSRQ